MKRTFAERQREVAMASRAKTGFMPEQDARDPLTRYATDKLRRYRPNWDWENMRGSDVCIHWNLKDMQTLDAAIERVPVKNVVVQAGGNLGLFPKRLAEVFKIVYTFEPDPELFSHMLHNAPEKNIFPIQAALGCSNEPISMGTGRRDGSERMTHEGLTFIAGAGEIPQILLDDMQLSVCDFIYLDIEGYELNALRGAERTVQRCRPVIVAEINGNGKYYGVTREDTRNWFRRKDYTLLGRMSGDEIYIPSERAT